LHRAAIDKRQIPAPGAIKTKGRTMKRNTTIHPRFIARRLCPAVLTAALALAAIAPALADRDDDRSNNGGQPRHHPFIFPHHSRPYGKSYAEWSGAWWRWAYSFPAGEDKNPVQDPTGDLAGLGQSGPVWFLAGSFGQTVTRTATVPSDKALFFPIINTIWINIPELGDNPWSDEQRDFARDFIAPFTDNAFDLSCQIDGVEVMKLERYRTTTRDGKEYMITFPENNLWGLDAGVYGPSVDDGIYLMLAPLKVGSHTIRFTAASQGSFAGDFALDVTYHLKVVKPAHVFPPHARPYGKSQAEWSAAFWKNGIELPAAGNPLANGGCGALSDKVWFLAAPVAPGNYPCTIPKGRALFVPVLTVECSSLEPPESGFHGDTEQEQRECAKYWADHLVNVSIEIDGLPVQDLESRRFVSPQFAFNAPDPNILLVPGGGPGTAVADGYYVMIAPLPKGAHTVRVRGAFHFSMAEGDSFDLDLPTDATFNLTID
jgi:hypothetical protein